MKLGTVELSGARLLLTSSDQCNALNALEQEHTSGLTLTYPKGQSVSVPALLRTLVRALVGMHKIRQHREAVPVPML